MYLPTLKWTSSFLYETIARKKDIRNILLLQTNDNFFFHLSPLWEWISARLQLQPDFSFVLDFLCLPGSNLTI